MGTWIELSCQSIGRDVEYIEYILISRSDIDLEWTLGCGDDAHNTIMMEQLEERPNGGIDSV